MAKALIVYASRTGNTKKIGELMAEGLRMSGVEVDIKDVTEVKKVEDLQGYNAYLFGSATYHGQMMESMKTMLFLAEKAGLQGSCGGAFGSYGWSGEAPDRIFETMRHVLQMNMVADPLRLKNPNMEGGLQMAQGYGKGLANKATGQ